MYWAHTEESYWQPKRDPETRPAYNRQKRKNLHLLD
jgi:hypothetical protein